MLWSSRSSQTSAQQAARLWEACAHAMHARTSGVMIVPHPPGHSQRNCAQRAHTFHSHCCRQKHCSQAVVREAGCVVGRGEGGEQGRSSDGGDCERSTQREPLAGGSVAAGVMTRLWDRGRSARRCTAAWSSTRSSSRKKKSHRSQALRCPQCSSGTPGAHAPQAETQDVACGTSARRVHVLRWCSSSVRAGRSRRMWPTPSRRRSCSCECVRGPHSRPAPACP